MISIMIAEAEIGSATETAQHVAPRAAAAAIDQLVAQASSVAVDPWSAIDLIAGFENPIFGSQALVAFADQASRWTTTGALQPVGVIALAEAVRSVLEQTSALTDTSLLPYEFDVVLRSPLALPAESAAIAHVRAILTRLPGPDQPSEEDVDPPMGFEFPDFR